MGCFRRQRRKSLFAASLSESKRKLKNKNKKSTIRMLTMIAFKINTNKTNLSQDGVTTILHSRNARHRSEKNFWSSHLQFKIVTLRICKTMILHLRFTDVKSGLSFYGEGKDCGFSRTGC
jgi:hypothetical protein